MPISFEQPAPVDADLYSQVGFLEQQQRGMQQARQAALQQQESNRAEAQLAMQAAAQGQHAYEFDQSRMPSARDFFESEQRSQGLQEQASIAAQLHQVQLSQGEEMRRTRLESALDFVRNRPDLNDEEKQDMVMQIQTGLSPLQQRHQRTALLQQEAQLEHLRQINAIQAVTARQNERFMNGRPEDLWRTVEDPRIAQEVRDDMARDYPSLAEYPDSQQYQDVYQEELQRRGGNQRFLMTAPGHYQHVPNTREQESLQVSNQILHEAESMVREELRHYRSAQFQGTPPDWVTTPGGVDAEITRVVQRRRQALGLGADRGRRGAGGGRSPAEVAEQLRQAALQAGQAPTAAIRVDQPVAPSTLERLGNAAIQTPLRPTFQPLSQQFLQSNATPQQARAFFRNAVERQNAALPARHRLSAAEIDAEVERRMQAFQGG